MVRRSFVSGLVGCVVLGLEVGAARCVKLRLSLFSSCLLGNEPPLRAPSSRALCQSNPLHPLGRYAAARHARFACDLGVFHARLGEETHRGTGAAVLLVVAAHTWGDCYRQARSVADAVEVGVGHARFLTVVYVSAAQCILSPAVGVDISDLDVLRMAGRNATGDSPSRIHASINCLSCGTFLALHLVDDSARRIRDGHHEDPERDTDCQCLALVGVDAEYGSR